MSDLQSSSNLQVQEVFNLVKQRIQFYTEENARMENFFRRLQIINQKLVSNENSTDILDKMCDIQEKMSIDDLSLNSATLSHVMNLRSHKNYIAKLKICTKMYIKLNDKLSEDIRITRIQLKQSKERANQMVTVTFAELRTMEEKIKRYESELVKFEKKHPWLKFPEYDLPNIAKEITLLEELKHQKEQLVQELKCYHGLRPDLTEATSQLTDIKIQYQEVNDKLVKGLK